MERFTGEAAALHRVSGSYIANLLDRTVSDAACNAKPYKHAHARFVKDTRTPANQPQAGLTPTNA
ncbi:hypothetical protein JMJ77_0004290 [Colletotrichum scovillei]|uniref:Uncharacterized protein n=1 Tax=Colletotrichum scovillei TaxID=1209932 RepID=A0A9P7U8W9_9PEZI|nr:hypothetical protein JMJ77_0004290 [Colletotrichum scovillei]KAG7049543.1 hypothetical protein JMJ78_0013524 [Colletotrichum scovillei]KAG7064283.1 hypothetical protein JMJ76_0007329 [Colletotrichum scovillei]